MFVCVMVVGNVVSENSWTTRDPGKVQPPNFGKANGKIFQNFAF